MAKLFEKVKCNGFFKKIHDGIWIDLDETTLTATAKNSHLPDCGIIEKDVDCIEKTYYKHKTATFSGIIVGFVDLTITGYLDVIYEDECDVGIGVIPAKFFVSKRPKDIVKCAIVYYSNNKKHYTPLEDIEESEDSE